MPGIYYSTLKFQVLSYNLLNIGYIIYSLSLEKFWHISDYNTGMHVHEELLSNIVLNIIHAEIMVMVWLRCHAHLNILMWKS